MTKNITDLILTFKIGTILTTQLESQPLKLSSVIEIHYYYIVT